MGTIPGIAIKRSRCNPAPSVLHTRSGSISGQVKTFSPRFVTLWNNYKAKLFLFLFFSGINYTPTMLCQFKNNSRVFMDDVVEVQCYLPWPHFYGFTASSSHLPPRNDMQVTGVVFLWWRSIKEVLSRWTGDQANVEFYSWFYCHQSTVSHCPGRPPEEPLPISPQLLATHILP